MADLQLVLDNMKQLKKDLPLIVSEAFEENATLIEDLNISQLDKGTRSDGSTLPDYSIGSVRRFGKKPGPMTMEHTGAFKKGIDLRVTVTDFELIGKDPKTRMLEKKYGQPATLIGITPSNDAVVLAIVTPSIQEKIDNRLSA